MTQAQYIKRLMMIGLPVPVDTYMQRYRAVPRDRYGYPQR